MRADQAPDARFRGGETRPPLPFRHINRKGRPGYMPQMQRHHLLPWQLLQNRDFALLLERAGGARRAMDDFRSNGLLLPASEPAAVRCGLPLHRGPHRNYNALVAERVGTITGCWADARLRHEALATADAIGRLRLLQGALRRRLLDEARPLVLNRRDPLGKGLDFSALDAMVEQLWAATA